MPNAKNRSTGYHCSREPGKKTGAIAIVCLFLDYRDFQPLAGSFPVVVTKTPLWLGPGSPHQSTNLSEAVKNDPPTVAVYSEDPDGRPEGCVPADFIHPRQSVGFRTGEGRLREVLKSSTPRSRFHPKLW